MTIFQHMVGHNNWANRRLIDFCAGLTHEQRQLTVPGTYGTVQATLAHLVAAEGRYFKHLTGAPQDHPVTDLDAGMETISRAAEELAGRWEKLSAGPEDIDRVIAHPSGDVSAWTVLAQIIHHGSDHRAHVATVLGAHGIESPDIDVWAYREALASTVR